MKTIIAGSREGFTYDDVVKAVQQSGFRLSHIISGGARGVDTLAVEFATKNEILYTVFEAQWDTYGKSAGYRRNEEMASNSEALIALWDGKSKGTKHMIDIANKRGLRVYVFRKQAD